MSSQSLRTPTRDSFGTPPWESREKEPFGCSLRGELQCEPLAGREATALSIIIRVREVHRREETPPDGGVVTPKNIQMQPFRSKNKFNFILNFEVFVGPGGSDGLPSGHADFDNGHPGLLENFVEGVAVVEVLVAPLGPKVI